jgi:hypothetical protein
VEEEQKLRKQMRKDKPEPIDPLMPPPSDDFFPPP